MGILLQQALAARKPSLWMAALAARSATAKTAIMAATGFAASWLAPRAGQLMSQRRLAPRLFPSAILPPLITPCLIRPAPAMPRA